jgi:anti-anti-sigma factor
MKGRICVVHLDQRVLDEDVMFETEQAFDKLVKNMGIDGILVSFEKLTKLASSGLGLMMKASRDLHDRAARFGLCNMSERHRRLFQMARLDTVLQIYPSEEVALAAMRSPEPAPQGGPSERAAGAAGSTRLASGRSRKSKRARPRRRKLPDASRS